MPPQPGTFAISPFTQSHKSRTSNYEAQLGPLDSVSNYQMNVASSSRSAQGYGVEDPKRSKKPKDFTSRLTKELSERRDEHHSAAAISVLHSTSSQLSNRPQTNQLYLMRMYPISLERSALLSQLEMEEEYALEGVRTAWEEEKDRVEEEYRRGRDRVRERLLEGVEERRRRAREEKDGEGTVDATMDSQSRSHITRKLRNKMGTPPPVILPSGPGSNQSVAVAPVPNPNSLSVDEIPSPFPLPLTSSSLPYGYGNNGRRKAKGAGVQPQALTGLGKAISQLTAGKEMEIDSDLGEIRRYAKRRRAAAASNKT